MQRAVEQQCDCRQICSLGREGKGGGMPSWRLSSCSHWDVTLRRFGRTYRLRPHGSGYSEQATGKKHAASFKPVNLAHNHLNIRLHLTENTFQVAAYNVMLQFRLNNKQDADFRK